MICSLLLLQRPLQRALHLAIPIDWVPKPRSTLPELVAPRLRDRAERRSSRLRGSRRPPPPRGRAAVVRLVPHSASSCDSDSTSATQSPTVAVPPSIVRSSASTSGSFWRRIARA